MDDDLKLELEKEGYREDKKRELKIVCTARECKMIERDNKRYKLIASTVLKDFCLNCNYCRVYVFEEADA